MRKFLGFAEQGFTVISLVLYTGGVLPVILSGGISEGVNGPPVAPDFALLRLLFFFIYVVTLFLLVAHWKKVLYVLSKDRFLWILVGLAVVSVLWSDAPEITKIRSIALVGTTLFGLYLATRYSLKQQIQLLGWTFGIVLVLSLLFALVLRKYGIEGGIHAPAWRGIYTHKNVFGKMMILSALTFLLLATGSTKNRRLLWCGFGLSISFLLLARSTSSLGNLVILILVFFVLRPFRWRYDLMIPALIAIATVGGSLIAWFMANANVVLGAVGKDTNLTGRGDMWPYILEKIWERPWLGYGYSAFWRGLDGESAYVWYAVRWQPPHAHNGFLDLWLNVGLLGVSIFAIGFVISFLRALAWVRLSRKSEGFWPGIYLIYFLLGNQTETSLMIQNDIFWVLYVAVALSLCLPMEQQTQALAST